MSRLAQRIAKLERSRGNGYVATRFLSGSSEMTAADYKRLKEQTLRRVERQPLRPCGLTARQPDATALLRVAVRRTQRSGVGARVHRASAPSRFWEANS
jgi:hypothetical protein